MKPVIFDTNNAFINNLNNNPVKNIINKTLNSLVKITEIIQEIAIIIFDTISVDADSLKFSKPLNTEVYTLSSCSIHIINPERMRILLISFLLPMFLKNTLISKKTAIRMMKKIIAESDNTIKIDVSYLFSASKVKNPLENTLRFSLSFAFGDEYDEY